MERPAVSESAMGIRYYAYAFNSDQTEKALADPLTVIGSDPLADSLGLEPGFTVGVTDFKQSLPERDFLYLDKAWSQLQRITAPCPSGGEARVAYRMFVLSTLWPRRGGDSSTRSGERLVLSSLSVPDGKVWLHLGNNFTMLPF